jgi:prevent-host-death family protein
MQFTARSTVERHTTLEDVKAAEQKAIETERPLFNRQYNNTPEARGRLRAYLNEIGRMDLLGPCGDTSPINLMSADEARLNFAAMLERAHFRGEHVGITRNGQPWVVVVSREWYEQAKALISDSNEGQR